LREQIQQPNPNRTLARFLPAPFLILYELGVVKEYESVHLDNQVINRISPALPFIVNGQSHDSIKVVGGKQYGQKLDKRMAVGETLSQGVGNSSHDALFLLDTAARRIASL
jgi:hypothetical protein